MPPYSTGFETPRKPACPSLPKSSCAGNACASSHASTCGLISRSMNLLSERYSSSCSWVRCIASLRCRGFRTGRKARVAPGDCRLEAVAPRDLLEFPSLRRLEVLDLDGEI